MRENDLDTIVAYTVGYMLKVLKNDKDISGERKEFASIRHGNYNEFIQLIGGEIPPMVIGGDIEPVVLGEGDRNSELNFLKNECDFIQLNAAGPSLKIFLRKCFEKHDNFNDDDITDETYKKLAIFEIRIRTHASNRKLIQPNDTLETIIDKVGEFFNLSTENIQQLHQGRRFLNRVKHNKNTTYDWKANCNEFNKAYDILSQNKIRLI